MRQPLKNRLLVGSVALALVTMAGCSNGDGSSDTKANLSPESLPETSLKELRVAWSYQDMTLDPATYYGGSGFSTMGALYEGLVQYGRGGVEIEPQLAESWEISPDGKTYTFKLRDDATFHDGTPVNAEAFKYSFQRFIDLKGAPSYMLSGVTSLEAPAPDTFVIKLGNANNALLDYLASYVGPKAMSPTALKANAGKDQGQTWLVKNDAGSGPYELSDVQIDQGLKLTAYPDYWGTPAKIPTVDVSIVPDISQQVLLLQGGDLDLIQSQVPPNLDKKMKTDDKLSVLAYPSVVKPSVWLKDAGIFKDKDTRLALIKAINRDVIAEGAYGDEASASKSLIPVTMIGGDDESDNPGYDPQPLTDIVAKSSPPAMVIGYREGLARDGLAAELMQAQLQAAGLEVTVRAYGPEFYGFSSHPADAPDLMVLGINADAASPAAWLSAYFKGGGAVTMNGVTVAAGDEALEQAIHETDMTAAEAGYEKAARAYAESGFFFTLADVKSLEYARTEVGPIAYTAGNPFGPMLSLVGTSK